MVGGSFANGRGFSSIAVEVGDWCLDMVLLEMSSTEARKLILSEKTDKK